MQLGTDHWVMPTVVVWDCETDIQLPRGDAGERDLAMQRSEVTVLCCLVFDSGDALIPGNFEAGTTPPGSYPNTWGSTRHLVTCRQALPPLRAVVILGDL